MLVFVIPLKSAQVSNSWELVSKLFERCIRSVCNQTSNKFQVIVVCHEKPQIEFSHPHITYIEVDFPSPTPGNDSKHLDKIRKLFVGLNYARQLEMSHTMNVDADDCVSKHLAEFVKHNSQSNGWFVNKGYLYQDGSKFVYLKRKDFYKWCGTSNIVRFDLIDLPENVEKKGLDLYNYYSSHRKVMEKLAQNGTPIKPLPFAGATYIVSNGENLSNNGDHLTPYNNVFSKKGIVSHLKNALLNFRVLSNSLREEFSIYDIS